MLPYPAASKFIFPVRPACPGAPRGGAPLRSPCSGAPRSQLGDIYLSNARSMLFIALVKRFSSHFYILMDLYFILFQGDFEAAYENT